MVDLAWLAAKVAVLALVLYALYITLRNPRPRLVHAAGQWPRVRVHSLIWWLLGTPIVVALWIGTLFVVLILAGTAISPDWLMLTACSVVLASRVLVVVNQRAAHELAKTLPWALVGFLLLRGVLIDPEGGWFDRQRFDEITRQLDLRVRNDDDLVTLVIVAEYVMGAVYYAQAAWQDHGHHPWRTAMRWWGGVRPRWMGWFTAVIPFPPHRDASTGADAQPDPGPQREPQPLALGRLDLVPEQTRDDRDDAEPRRGGDDGTARYLAERPPHHGD